MNKLENYFALVPTFYFDEEETYELHGLYRRSWNTRLVEVVFSKRFRNSGYQVLVNLNDNLSYELNFEEREEAFNFWLKCLECGISPSFLTENGFIKKED